MNTRIRYSKLADGSWVSMRVIKGENSKEFRAYINSDGKSGFVEDLSAASPPVQVGGSSSHKVKIGLKNTLKTLGCSFVKESRGE